MTQTRILPAAARAIALSAAVAAGGLLAADPASAWSLEEAAKSYAGQTIHCVGDGYAPYLAYQKLSEDFTKLTGIKVEWEVADLAVLQQKMLADVMNSTGVYDCAEVTSIDVGLWIARDFVQPMFKFLEDAKLHDPSFDPWTAYVPATLAFSSVEDGKIYGLPYHFIPRFMVVRKDIAACPSEQAAFQAKHGHALPVTPATWAAFREVAEFFTRKAGEKLCDQPLAEDFYGTAISFKRYIATQYDFEMFLNAFGAVFFKGDGPIASAQGFKSGSDIAFDSKEAIESLEYWLSLRKFVPPGYLEYTWDNTFSDVCQGKVYTYGSWGDTTPFLEDPSDQGCPKVAGKFTYYPVPGTNQTGGEGQTWLIPKSSKHGEATFLFLQWIASADIMRKCQAIGCTSPRKEAWYAPEFDNEGRAQITRWLIDHDKVIARGHPAALSKISAILIDELQAAARDEKTAEQALKTAAEKSRAALKQ